MAEHFIPFYKSEIVDYLCKMEKIGGKEEKFREFCRMVESLYHFNYHSKLENIKEKYIDYDPDADRFMNKIESVRKDKIGEEKESVLEEIKELLKAGNYQEISKEELEKAFSGSSPWGVDLDVDFNMFSSFSLFYRGGYEDEKEKKVAFFSKKYNFFVYSRVVFLFTVKEGAEDKTLESDKIYLKNFKNVPELDLEMIFPGTKVKIRLIDKMMVAVPLTIGVVTSVKKIVHYIMNSGKTLELVHQIGFWTLMGGFFLFAVKSYFNYKNTVEKYLKMLTQSLYLQNLDNNSGVFKNLIDDAEEQECKEVITAYYFLITEGEMGRKELKERVELFFKEKLNYSFEFEIDDAVRKLLENEIAEESGGKIKAVMVEEALEKLDYQWDNFFKYNK